eukprot:6491536-Amphidinium_carterae.3
MSGISLAAPSPPWGVRQGEWHLHMLVLVLVLLEDQMLDEVELLVDLDVNVVSRDHEAAEKGFSTAPPTLVHLVRWQVQGHEAAKG